MRNPIQLVKMMRAFVKLVRDPSHLDDVFQMGASLRSMAGPAERELMLKAVRRDAPAEEAFRTRPRIGRIDLEALARLPEETLGGAYARFMKDRKITPEAIPTLPDSDELEYLVAHLYETHDLWHVLTGFEIDTAGELGLQAFYLTRFPGAMSMFILIAGLMNAALFNLANGPRIVSEIARGWTLGKNARDLIGVDWKQEWNTPLAELRRRHGIEVPAATAPAALMPA